jgi:rubrerythrin
MEKELESKIIQALAINEELVSQLYGLYSQKFPEYKEFWGQLVKEEISHAALIRELYSQVGDGELYFSEKFSLAAIETFSAYLRDLLSQAQNKEILFVSALSQALDIERALIEKQYFDFFETDSVTLRHMLLTLKNDLERHAQMISDLLEEVKTKD